MDLRKLNSRINGLKEAYPNEQALIEGVQNLINTKIQVISEKNRHALRQFPMQFTRRVSLGDGEWTTTLHMWADNMVDTLLEIDPMYLTTSDSMGYTVLHALIFAATGKFTQLVNYDLIQKILDKNMGFMKLTVPGNPNSKVEDNAWTCKDVMQKTPMDYLVEFANGDPEGGIAPDETLQQMLLEFGQSPTVEAPVDNTPPMPTTDEQLAAVDQASGIGPDGKVDTQQAIASAEPEQPGDNQPDLTIAQQQQSAADATQNSNGPTTKEKEIQPAEPVAQAATQEKTNEKSDESPILETFLKLI